MIEKLVNSKTRLKILKLFLSNIDDRYYLRELERLLEESLSPLRRQLLKLTSIGILVTEVEANLKYYRLNKDFEGLGELRELVLESRNHAEAGLRPDAEITRKEEQRIMELNDIYAGNGLPRTEVKPFPARQFRYDLAVLSFVSVFVLITAIFVVYTNNKNIKQVTETISGRSLSSFVKASEDRSAATPIVVGVTRESTLDSIREDAQGGQGAPFRALSNGEMMSRKWKLFPGNIPAFFSGETGEEKNSKEL